MYSNIKSSITLVLLVLLASACNWQSERSKAELNLFLDSFRQEYAPDDRVELWDIAVNEANGMLQMEGELSNGETYVTVEEAVAKHFPEVKSALTLLPESGSGQFVNALVNNSVIHLRKEPSSTKELVTQALLGTPVRLLKTDGGKSLIQVPDGYIGWVNTAEVHLLDQEGLATYRGAEKLIFTAQFGTAYSEPDEQSMPTTDLVIGNIVCKVAEQGEFTQVSYPDGRLGWVYSEKLLPAEDIFYKSTLQENLVQTALKFHGIPYLWGGTSSKTIDCSGLVCNIYFMNGILLPRDADMQALIGRELTTEFSPDLLEPGDLLFFGRKATDGQEENVTHVAMYIGGGEYIHSAGYRERVSINSMDSSRENFIERYPEIFIRSVRIIGEAYKDFWPIPENPFYKEIISPTE